MASHSGSSLYEEILDYYNDKHFIMSDGSFNQETVVTRVTGLLLKKGLKDTNSIQSICGVTIYHKDFFNPYNPYTGVMNIKPETHSIHWYSFSWQSKPSRYISMIAKPVRRVFGENFFVNIKSFIKGKK